MRGRLGRISVMGGLILAIFGALGRRVWWTYRPRALHQRGPRPAIVQRQLAEPVLHVPRVTADWRPLAQQAISVQAAALLVEADGALVPVVWIDAREHAAISDLPRVLRNNDPPLVATQWLADDDRAAVLVATFVEPVIATWALRFERGRCEAVLHALATAARFFVALDQPPPTGPTTLPIVMRLDPHSSITLPLTTPAHLRALLQAFP